MHEINTVGRAMIAIKSKVSAIIAVAAVLVSFAAGAAAEETPDKAVYESGRALLEVFNTDSVDRIADIEPVFRVPWMHDFACMAPASGMNIWIVREGYQDAFLVPELAYGLGARPGTEYSYPYVARITFYYQADEPGKYTFSVWHGQNSCMLTVGNFLVTNLSAQQRAGEGVCVLEKGLHHVVFLLTSNIDSRPAKNDPYFLVKVHSPKASAATPITREMFFGEDPYNRRRR